MRTYRVTIEMPGLYGDSHYYTDVTVRAGSEEGARRAARKKNGGGNPIFVTVAR